MEKSKVYFTKDISPEGLIKVFDALNRELKGKVAIKISTGEPGGHNFLNPKLIKPPIDKLNGTIVECCTAYAGRRENPKEHWKAIKEHGFLDIAPCDIMDEEGEMKIYFEGGRHLQGYDIVGTHLKNYDSMLMLSHFKGHAMGGFGGALKNMSIGVASRNGKAWIHSSGHTADPVILWDFVGDQEGFLESMAEACKAVVTFFKQENIAYVNVANNLSVDCDCDSNPHAPEMADIGIFASLDPVAIDQCCYDQVVNSDDPGKKALIERMNSRHGIHTVEEACRLGLGSREYELIDIDKE